MLTATKLRNLRPTDKVTKHFDRNGLHLVLRPTGTATWKYKYRHQGKEQLLTIGKYPATSLLEARELHREAQAQLDSGNNPVAVKRQEQANTFEAVSWRWYEIQKSDSYSNDSIFSPP